MYIAARGRARDTSAAQATLINRPLCPCSHALGSLAMPTSVPLNSALVQFHSLPPLHLPPAPGPRLACPHQPPRRSWIHLDGAFNVLCSCLPLGLPCSPPFPPSHPSPSSWNRTRGMHEDAADLLLRPILFPVCLIGMSKPSRPRLFHPLPCHSCHPPTFATLTAQIAPHPRACRPRWRHTFRAVTPARCPYTCSPLPLPLPRAIAIWCRAAA